MCVYLPFGLLLLLLLSAPPQIILLFFCYSFILDHLLIDDISRIVVEESIFDIQVSSFKFATRIGIMDPDDSFAFEFYLHFIGKNCIFEFLRQK